MIALAPMAAGGSRFQTAPAQPAAVPRPPARPPDIFFVPTRQSIVEAMLQLAGVTANDVVYDLGSGDGRIVVLAAQNHGARGVGVEIDPALVDISRQVARDAQVDSKVKFIEGDLFDADLSEATVVTLFLSPGINRRLEPKLKRELRNGARIVSRQFDMGGWAADRSVLAEDGTTLFLWTIRR
jgi:SAM-dependent methyltransferase